MSGNLILRNASSGSAQNGASERGGKQVQALQRNSQLFIWKKTNSLGSQPNRTLHDFRLDKLAKLKHQSFANKGSRQNFATILILLQLRDFSTFYQNWLVSLANCGTWMVESWSFVGSLVRWGVKDQRDSCRLHPALERLNPRHRKGSLSAWQLRRLGSYPVSFIGS